MTIDDKITDEKVKYDIKREAAKISALSSGKIDKYLPGEEISPSNQRKANKTIIMTSQNKLSLHILHSVKHLKNK